MEILGFCCHCSVGNCQSLAAKKLDPGLVGSPSEQELPEPPQSPDAELGAVERVEECSDDMMMGESWGRFMNSDESVDRECCLDLIGCWAKMHLDRAFVYCRG